MPRPHARADGPAVGASALHTPGLDLAYRPPRMDALRRQSVGFSVSPLASSINLGPQILAHRKIPKLVLFRPLFGMCLAHLTQGYDERPGPAYAQGPHIYHLLGQPELRWEAAGLILSEQGEQRVGGKLLLPASASMMGECISAFASPVMGGSSLPIIKSFSPQGLCHGGTVGHGPSSGSHCSLVGRQDGAHLGRRVRRLHQDVHWAHVTRHGSVLAARQDGPARVRWGEGKEGVFLK